MNREAATSGGSITRAGRRPSRLVARRRWITFTTEPGGPESILAVRPDGTGLHSLRPATSRLQFYKAAFSPDGHNILVGCNDLVTHVDKICG